MQIGDILLYKDSTGSVNVGQLEELPHRSRNRLKKRGAARPIFSIMPTSGTAVWRNKRSRVRTYTACIPATTAGSAQSFCFANTIIGRLILLLIPTFLIFFYEPIVNFFKTITKEKQARERGEATPS